jgi:hypothetical protein
MKNIECVLRSTLTLYIHTYSELSRSRGRDAAAPRNRAERTTGDSYREGKEEHDSARLRVMASTGHE